MGTMLLFFQVPIKTYQRKTEYHGRLFIKSGRVLYQILFNKRTEGNDINHQSCLTTQQT